MTKLSKQRRRSFHKSDSKAFYLPAITVYWRKEVADGPPKLQERTVNLIAETTGPVNKDDLYNMQQEAFRRANAENGVTNEQLVDVVVQNLNFMGWMTQEEFHGSEAAEHELAQADTAGTA